MAVSVAIAPLALIIFLMAVLRWSAAGAGLVGLVAATVGAIGFFGFGTNVHADQGITGAFIGTGAEAAFSSLDILWIILPALSLYELQRHSGAIEAIRTALMSLSPDKTLLALIIAWFFAPFMEGAAGFGTPIALAAPLLVSLGFTPVVAVALPLIGHVVGNSFGALGTPIFAQADVSGMSGGNIAPPTALLHASLAPVLALAIVFIAETGRVQAKHAAWAVFAAACLLLPYLGLAAFVGAELPALAGALVGGLACFCPPAAGCAASSSARCGIACPGCNTVRAPGWLDPRDAFGPIDQGRTPAGRTRMEPARTIRRPYRTPLSSGHHVARRISLRRALTRPYRGRACRRGRRCRSPAGARGNRLVRNACNRPGDGACGHDPGAGGGGDTDRLGVAAAGPFGWRTRGLRHWLHNRLQYPPDGSATSGGYRPGSSAARPDSGSGIWCGYRQQRGAAQHHYRRGNSRSART